VCGGGLLWLVGFVGGRGKGCLVGFFFFCVVGGGGGGGGGSMANWRTGIGSPGFCSEMSFPSL